jgi:hypothetical protein
MPSPVGPTLTAITLIEWTADYVPAEYMMPETRLALDLVRHMSTAVITTTSIQPYSPEIAMVSGGFLLILGAYEATHRYGKAKGYSICVVDFKEIVSNFICLDPEDRKRLLAAFRAYKEFQRQFQITSSSHRPRLESPRVSNRIEEVTETIQETANTIPVVTESEILPSAIAPSSAIPGPSVSWTGWKAQNPVKPFSDFNNEGIAKVQKKWKAPFSMMNVKKGNPPPETYNQLFTRSIQLPSNKLQGAANPQPSTTKLTGSFFSSASTRLLRPWVR